MYKLIVSDIDGTLLRNDKTISKEANDIVNKVIEDGIKFVIATGRVFPTAKWAYLDLGIAGPIIACNGSLIKDTATGEILYEKPLGKAKAKEVVEICRKYNLYFHFYSEDTIYSEKYEHIIKSYGEMSKNLPLERQVKIEVVSDSIELIDKIDKIYKIGIFSGESENFLEAIEEINGVEGISSYKSLETSFDVMEEGVSKGSAIAELNRIFAITRDETIAIGDNENDSFMIEYAGLGVAMGNAIEQVKNIANYVTETNENDGIVKMINKYIYGV